MMKENDKISNSSVFEGMTSISAIIKAIEANKSDRRILKILFDKAKIHSKRPEYGFLKAKSSEFCFPIELSDAETISKLAVGTSHGGVIAICSERTVPRLSREAIKPEGIYYMAGKKLTLLFSTPAQ